MLYRVGFTITDYAESGFVVNSIDIWVYGIGKNRDEAIKFTKTHKQLVNTDKRKFTNFKTSIIQRKYDGDFKLYRVFYYEKNKIVNCFVIGRTEEEAVNYASAFGSLDAREYAASLVKKLCETDYIVMPVMDDEEDVTSYPLMPKANKNHKNKLYKVDFKITYPTHTIPISTYGIGKTPDEAIEFVKKYKRNTYGKEVFSDFKVSLVDKIKGTYKLYHINYKKYNSATSSFTNAEMLVIGKTEDEASKYVLAYTSFDDKEFEFHIMGDLCEGEHDIIIV